MGEEQAVFPFTVTPSNAGLGDKEGLFLFFEPGKVGSDLAFAFRLVIIEGENKAPLYFCSPLLSAKS